MPTTSHDAHIEDKEERQERRAALSFSDMASPRWMLYIGGDAPVLVRYLTPYEELLTEEFPYFAGSAGSVIARRAKQPDSRIWLGNWLVAVDKVIPLDRSATPPFDVDSDELTPLFESEDEAAAIEAIETLTEAIANAEEEPDHIRTAWSGLVAATSQFISTFPEQFSDTSIQDIRVAIEAQGKSVDPQYTNELLSGLAALHDKGVNTEAVKDVFVKILASSRLHAKAANHALSLFIDRFDDVSNEQLLDIVAQHEILLGLSSYRNQLSNDEYELYVHRIRRLEERSDLQ